MVDRPNEGRPSGWETTNLYQKGAYPGERRLPAGTLKEWHWRALAKAYAPGDEGLWDDGIIGNYGGIGVGTWRRLASYRAGHFDALVELRRVGMRPGHLRSEPDYLLFGTGSGRHFYEERFDENTQRYPEVKAAPTFKGTRRPRQGREADRARTSR